jgi:prevent-host-death family protein
MKQMAAAKFKEQCLSILDDVDEEGLVITKRGKPVAKLIPIRAESASLIGALKGKIKIKGNVFSTGAKWDAQS